MVEKNKITLSEYIDAKNIASQYEYQIKSEHLNTFKLNQEVVFKGSSTIYYFKEYDFVNDELLVATNKSVDVDDYNDHWVDFDKIEAYTINNVNQ